MAEHEDFRIDEEMRYQQNKDIANRSITGTFIYLLIWLAITLPQGFQTSSPRTWWSLALLFTVMGSIRIVMIKNFERIYSHNPFAWKWWYFSFAWLSALIWGLLCAASLIMPTFQSLAFVLITSTAGITAGACASVAPGRLITLGMLSALLFPAIITLIALPNDYGASLWLIFILFWIGMFSITKIQYNEYWLNLKHSVVIKRYATELERLNTIDGLTGLKNRKYFDDTLRTELKRSSRSDTPISLLLVDIDHFKSVNDQFGHLAGDECLRQISQLLMQTVQRETDIVARFGGEEFAIIMPITSADNACTVAERIRQAVETMSITWQDIELKLTISIGLAGTIASGDTSNDEIIAVADAALYGAKSEGRNRVNMGTMT